MSILSQNVNNKRISTILKYIHDNNGDSDAVWMDCGCYDDDGDGDGNNNDDDYIVNNESNLWVFINNDNLFGLIKTFTKNKSSNHLTEQCLVICLLFMYIEEYIIFIIQEDLCTVTK